MTLKALMVDVDGVLLVHPDPRGWSVNLERELGVSPSALQSGFFACHWDDIVHGRAGLRDRLAPVLREISPNVPCDRLINYWFGNDAHVNLALLEELSSFQAGGLKVHLATTQEHERAAYIWDGLGFGSRFDGLHYAADLGCSKPSAAFFRAVERRTGYAAGELFLIDDRQDNVEGARACGWEAALWTGRDDVRSLLTASQGAGRG